MEGDAENAKSSLELLEESSSEGQLSFYRTMILYVHNLVESDIQSRSQAVFADVQDDFYDIKKILSRFEEWRRSYSESYHNAYISLCLPKLLNPIIRQQLLVWNPLKVSGYVKNA
ncbi:hypothetical protein XENOCAPTIV_004644 [Xenoophorus captivus]|uniref:GCF C-terminal domain-containing protein n=1 Tax=Xenoophorus captivus TaxID=1517983 RepID=A0ABV0RBT8_9TELE